MSPTLTATRWRAVAATAAIAAAAPLLVLSAKAAHGQTDSSPSASPVGSTAAAASAATTPPPAPSVATTTQHVAALTRPAPPRGEIRAMWVVRDSLTSPEKVRNVVALAKRYGFNTLFVQVRGRGDAFYDSRYEPRAEELAGQPSDFDPLAMAVAEGHRAGLEVHAWLNTFFVWHRPRHPWSSEHVVNQHPDWLVQDMQGRVTMTEQSDCEGAFLDPALPEVREYTKKVFLDVATRYAVDGIHFDYVRFPSDRFSFSDRDLGLFRDWLTPQISGADAAYADSRLDGSRLAWYYLYPEQWRIWRESVVTETVRSIADEVHRVRPGVIVSAAVFPNYMVASRDKGQDWHRWLAMGALDAACPMAYNRSTTLVGAQIRDAVASSGGRPIVGGIGAWQMAPGSAIAKGQLYRALGAGGINFFSYDGMTRDGQSDAYLAKVAAYLFNSPTLPPDWHRLTTATVAQSVGANSSQSSPSTSGG